MLFVIVRIGDARYAIPAGDIVAIAPSAPATRIPGTARSVAGLFEYLGRPVPLLDLGELCRATPCDETPSTRILIVKSKESGHLVGVRAEGVTSTLRMESGAFEAPGVPSPPYLTGVALTGAGAILQRIDLHRLLSLDAELEGAVR